MKVSSDTQNYELVAHFKLLLAEQRRLERELNAVRNELQTRLSRGALTIEFILEPKK